jgi:hypothetical protein
MQPLVVVSKFKEGRQIGTHCVEVAPAVAAHLLLLRVFMKDSALALS